MRENKSEIEIPLENIQKHLKLYIYGDMEQTIYQIDEEEAIENGEAVYQLLEGNFYSYYFKLADKPNHDYQLRKDSNGIVNNARRKDVSEGRISPNIYVGTLQIEIYRIGNPELTIDSISLEVLATKMNSKVDKSYRENYRYMLKDITEKCTELLLQINSPVTQNFETDFNQDNETIYQRFAFVQSLIQSNEFNEAVQKIISSPTTKWKEEPELKDIRSVRRFSNAAIRQIVSGSNRIKLPNPIGVLSDIPAKIITSQKSETVDTPENRFIKYALEVFLKFCADCKDIFKQENYEKSVKEASFLMEQLENHLNHPFFKEIERPTTLKLNSPALQRKSGYREVLNAWLQFDLAAKLIWKGGDDVYKAGKRDIAVLYEYWLFFILYDLIKSKFKLDTSLHENKNYDDLIVETKDGLNVMLKSGKLTALEGVFDSGTRKLHIRLSYNKTFSGDIKYQDKKEGSWTKVLRPDYTLSIWPEGMEDNEAEEEEKIVHIHFDSKYKVDNFIVEKEVTIIKTDDGEETDSLEIEKKEERKGNFKNADLLKMHAYKDAIRRTGGSYILYPGTGVKNFEGFHEIIPGLGAFAICPNEGENGTKALADFIDKVIDHFNNMASQQRRLSSKVYEIHENENPDIVNDSLPEYLIPDETYVLVGFYKKENWNWIIESGLYNVRTENTRGSLRLGPGESSAKYLLLHTDNETTTGKLLKIVEEGPRVFSKKKLISKGYPSEPSQDFYLVYKVAEISDTELLNKSWDITKLEKYKKGPGSALPFAVSMTELMREK